MVLIVEDEPIQRLNLVDILEEGGFDPVDVGNAAQAISILEARDDIRLLVTDVDMPGGMDGARLAAVVRDRWPPIEIAIVSARPPPDPASMPARSVFIAKPFTAEDLLRTLRRLIDDLACL